MVFEISSKLHLEAGKKQFSIPPGVYVYVGSALGGLDQRVKRHILKANPVENSNASKAGKVYRDHWHIDYLLHHAKNISAVKACANFRTECLLALALKERGMVAVKGFGSSDCRSACGGHLLIAPSGDRSLALNLVSEAFLKMGIEKVAII